jgi:cytosine/adenosine deaminase-related metal-dependent hydrolase
MIRHLMAATALLATSALAAPADTVLLHGRIITADANDSVVQALAISGGKIAAVGSDASISALIGPKTKVIDLKGRAATPGLIDTHAHILSTGLGELNEIALGGARSQATNGDKDARIFLRADKAVAYGELMEVMNLLRGAGFLKVALVGRSGSVALRGVEAATDDA